MKITAVKTAATQGHGMHLWVRVETDEGVERVGNGFKFDQGGFDPASHIPDPIGFHGILKDKEGPPNRCLQIVSDVRGYLFQGRNAQFQPRQRDIDLRRKDVDFIHPR